MCIRDRVSNIAGGQATFLVDGLQFIVAILLMVLGVLVEMCIRDSINRI